MKKLTNTLFLICATLLAFAQVDNNLSTKFKSAQAGRMRLDSIHYEPYNPTTLEFKLSSKQEFIYDTNGNEIEKRYYGLTNSGWDLSRKEVYEYDSNNNLITEIYYPSKNADGSLRPSSKFEYAFDDAGNKTLDAEYFWYPDLNSWAGIEKVEYEYDLYGNKIFEKLYGWSISSNDWWGVMYLEDNYDSSGVQTLESRYNFDQVGKVWHGDYKNIKNVDSNGNVTEEYMYIWNFVIDDWEFLAGFNHVYETINNQKVEFIQNWNSTDSTWHNSRKVEIIAQADTLLITINWKASGGGWQGISKSEIGYDSFGNEILNISYNWDTDSSDWIGYQKSEYAFDAKGNKLLEAHYRWSVDLNIWVGDGSKYEFEFNSNGNQVLLIYYSWLNDSNNWILSQKLVDVYDDNDNHIAIERYNWDRNLGEWIMIWKRPQYFNSQNYLIGWEEFTWETDSNRWKGNDKYEFEPDENGNMVVGIDYNWDKTTCDWIESSKVETQLNLAYSYEDLILPTSPLAFFSIFSPWYYQRLNSYRNMVTQLVGYNWNKDINDWQPDGIHKFFYSGDVNNNIIQLDETEMLVYPNPASDFITIGNISHSTHFQLFSVTGKLVLSKILESSEDVSVQGLKPGMYFYRLETKNQQQKGKLVIQ